MVLMYATIASISAGLKWYLKPGIFGVPLAMNTRSASSCPPIDTRDSTGPYCGLVICGLVWQTRQDWLKCRMTCNCWASGSCASAATGATTSKASTIFALRLMNLLRAEADAQMVVPTRKKVSLIFESRLGLQDLSGCGGD